MFIYGSFLFMILFLALPVIALLAWMPWLVTYPKSGIVQSGLIAYYLLLGWGFWRALRYTVCRMQRHPPDAAAPN